MNRNDRREFFRACARGLIAGVLGALGVVLGARRPQPGAHVCRNHGICRGCGAFRDCTLPQALSAKQHKRRMNDE